MALVCLVTVRVGSETVFDDLGVVVANLVEGLGVKVDVATVLAGVCSHTSVVSPINDGSLLLARRVSSSSSNDVEADPSDEPVSTYDSEVTVVASVVVVVAVGLCRARSADVVLAFTLVLGTETGFFVRFAPGWLTSC